MRWLVWFVLGFGGACAACAAGAREAAWLFVPLCFLLWGVLLLPDRRPRPLRALVVLLLGSGVGFGWFWLYDGAYLSAARMLDGQTISAAIEVSDRCFSTGYGVAADGRLTYDGRTWQVRFYWDDPEAAFAPGDRVEGIFRLRYTAPGGEEKATSHSGNGIFLLAYPVKGGQVTAEAGSAARYWPAVVRQAVLDRINAIFPEDTAGFARGLLLGDSYEIDYATDTALSVSGIRHVIAVSGLHVSVLCMLLMLLTGKRRFWSALVTVPALLLFAAVAGSTPSITRACLMMTMMLLARVFRREYDQLTALAFSALFMLTVNPWVITSVSFQLSIASVTGIVLLSERLYDWFLKKLGGAKGRTVRAGLARWIASSLAVSLGAMCLTLPLTAFHFGTVSLSSPLTNLLTLWVITAVFCAVMLACLLSVFWFPLGVGLAWLVSWPVRYVLAVAKLLSALPLAAVYTCSGPIVLWLVGSYLLLAICFLGKKRRPALFAGAVSVWLCLAVSWAWITPLLTEIQVTVLDVGQGQCVLLQSRGKTFMVDCGGDNNESAADLAAETLLSQGITHLDGLILTHYDQDHVGGVPYLLTRIDADTVFLPGEDTQGLTAGENTLRVEDNMRLSYGAADLTLFPDPAASSDNESSMCVLFQTPGYDILITGDRTTAGELRLMEQTELPELELLVAGHHGAKTSTGAALLAATSPDVVVISVGADNAYGHPDPAVLDRLAEYGCEVRRTDLDGTIVYKGCESNGGIFRKDRRPADAEGGAQGKKTGAAVSVLWGGDLPAAALPGPASPDAHRRSCGVL